ncbi:Microtubule-associated protein futsch [Halotydeus destructor]|nr:Microtubule-associated protein futsch [Halotydeus destructor]
MEQVCQQMQKSSIDSELLIQHSTEKLAVEVLLNPQVFTLKQCLKNLLVSPTGHKHLIYAGYSFTGTGSWMLQDGILKFQDFIELFKDEDVSSFFGGCSVGSVSMHIHAPSVGGWTSANLEKTVPSSLKIELNPEDSPSGVQGAASLLDFLDEVLTSNTTEKEMVSTPVVGNIRFNKPTLYVFPSGQGDCSLFGVTGFTMLIDGGFTPLPCFWNFVRHLERLDSIMVTRLNESNLWGVSSLFKKKVLKPTYPHIGYVFCNIGEGRPENGESVSVSSKDKSDLMVSVIDIGQEFLGNLKTVGLSPHQCIRESCLSPLTLYHKVGHGTLEMFILSPPRDSKVLKDFLKNWSSSKDSFAFVKTDSASDNGGQVAIPITNVMSICCLLIWRPAEAHENITRILFPGSAPQSKIFEGLEKIKHLDVLRSPQCSGASLKATSAPSSATSSATERQSKARVPSSESKVTSRLRSVSPSLRKPKPTRSSEADAKGDTMGSIKESPIHKRFQSVQRTPTVSNVKETVQVKSAPLHSRITKRSASKVDTKKPISGSADSKKVRAPPKSPVSDADYKDEKVSMKDDEVNLSEAVAVDARKESIASVSSHKEDSSLDSKVVDEIDALTLQNKQLLVNDHNLESESEAQAQSCVLEDAIIEECKDLTAEKMSDVTAHPDAVATDIDTAALPVEQPITLDAPPQTDLGHELKSTLSGSEELVQQMAEEEENEVVVSEISAEQTDVQTEPDSVAAELETAELEVDQSTVLSQSLSTDLHHELKSVLIDGSEELVKIDVDEAEIVPEIQDSETDIQETASANSKRSSLASSASLKDSTLVEALHEGSDLSFKTTEGDGPDFQQATPGDLDLVEPVSDIVESKLMPSLLNEEINGDRPMEEDLSRVMNSDTVPVSSTPVDVPISSRDEANSGNVSDSENLSDSEMISSVITELDKKTGIDLTDGRRESTSSIPLFTEKDLVSSTTVEVDVDTLAAEVEQLLIESPDLDSETVAVNVEDTIQQRDDFADNRSASTETTVSKHDVSENDEGIPTIENKDPVESEAKVIHEVRGTEKEVVEKVSQTTATQLQHGAESDANAEDELDNLNTQANDDVQEDSGQTTESTELTQISDKNHSADVGSKEPVIAKKEALDETVSDYTESEDASEPSQEKIVQPEVNLTGLQLDDAGKQLQKGSSDMSVDSADGVSGSADNRSSEKRDSLSSRKVSIVDSIKTIGDDAIAMINSFVASNDVDTDETMRLEADQVNSNEAEAVNVEKEESPLSSKTVEDVHVKPVFVNAEEVDVKPTSPVQATDSPDKISEEEKHSTASEISVSLAHRDSVAAATDVAELLIEPSTAFGKSSKTNELKSNVNDSAVEFGKQGILETARGAVSDEDDKDETFGRKLDEMNLNETVTEDVSKELIAPVSPHEEGSSLDSKMDDDDTVAVQDKLLPMKDHSVESKPVDVNLSVEKRDSLSMKNTSLVDSVKSIGDDEMAITKSFVASSDAAPEKEKSLEADEVSFSEAVAVDGRKESTASVSSHKDSKIVDDDIDALTVQNKQLLVNDHSLESEFEAQAESHDLQMEMIEEHEDLTARKMSAALAHPDAVATDIDTAALSVEQAITLEAPLQKDLGHELKSTLSVSDELAQQMAVEEKDKVVVSEVSADETDVQTKADSFAAEIETADLAVEQLTVSDQSPSTDLRHELKSVPIDGSEEIVKLGVDKAEIVPEIPDSETDIQETASANSKRSSLASSASLKDTTLVESLHEESDLAFKITEGDGASEDFQPTIPRDLNLEPVSEIVESKLMPSLLNEKIDGDRPMEEDLLRVTNSDAASVSSTPVDVLISSRDEANSANVSGSDKVPDSEMKGNVITDLDKKTGVDITDERRESTSSIQEQNEKYPMSSTTVDGDALVAEIEPVLIQVESPDLDPETVLVNNEDTTGINSPAKKVHEVGKQKDEFDDNRSASTETTVSKHDVDEKDEDIPTIEIEEPMKSEGKIICPVEETTEKDFEGAEDEVVEKVSQIMTTQLQHGAENDSNAEDAPENVKASVASHARANDNVQEDISRTTESTELTQISDTNHAADVGSKEPVNAVKEALDETVSDNTEKDVSESSEEKIEQPEVKLTGLQLDDAGKQLQKGSSDMSVDSADGVSGSADNRSSSEKRDSLSSRKVSIVDSMKTIGDDAVAMVKSLVASNDADSDEMLSIKAGEVNFDEGVSEVVAVDARKESIASVSSHKEDSSLDPKTAAEIDVLTVPDKPLLVPDHSLESKPETQAPSHGLQEEIIEECKDLTARKMSAALAHPDVVAIDIDTSALPVEKLIALDASPKTDLVNELKPIVSLPEQLAQRVAEEEVMSEMSVKQTDVQNKADSVANELEKADLAVEQSTVLDEFLSTDLGHELKPVLIDGSEELVKLDVDEADIASEIHVKKLIF